MTYCLSPESARCLSVGIPVDEAATIAGISLNEAWLGILDKVLPAEAVRLPAGGTAWRVTNAQVAAWRIYAESHR